MHRANIRLTVHLWTHGERLQTHIKIVNENGNGDAIPLSAFADILGIKELQPRE